MTIDLPVIGSMVRVRRGRQAYIPCKLVRIDGDYAYVLPPNHKKLERVPLNTIKRWKSRSQKS